MMTRIASIDVFISRKSADARLAKPIYQFLTDKGLTVFESDETLPRMGNSEYRKAIDQALDQCRHLIVVGSSIEHIQSSWVEAEWGFFIGEKRAGRKPGNLISVITEPLRIEQLPPSLRNYEVIYFDTTNFERLYAYVGKEGYIPQLGNPTWRLPTRWFWPALSIALLLVVAIGFTYYTNQPFDLTVFAQPASTLQLKPDYPAFTGGELVIYFDNKEEKKQTLANGEVIMKHLPASLLGRKVAVRLLANHWKAGKDSILVEHTVQLPIVPDGSLGSITGNVKTESGLPLAGARVLVNYDTTQILLTDEVGVFKTQLPYQLQGDHYTLFVFKEGFLSQRFLYYPKSGPTDVRLEKRTDANLILR